jgi:integrase
MNTLPGSLWINRGRWNWRVRLPNDTKRRNFPLRLPGQKQAIPEEKGQSLAESLAWKIWEKATRETESRHDNCMTLDAVAGRFLGWADTYYRRPDGTPTRERHNCELALRELRGRLGRESIDNIGYTAILDVRDDLEASGLNRSTINQRVGIWKRMIAWALDNRLCAATTKSEWWAIGNLKQNRTQAPEGKPVQPVHHLHVKRTLPYLSEIVRGMVQVQEYTGMRPGELCAMKPEEIEKQRRVWVYRPAQHKNTHRQKVRLIVIGPRAQRVLSPFLKNAKKGEPIFQPPRTNAEKSRPNGWPVKNYSWAVRYAVKAAKKEGVEVEHWSPNQLRHACGTRVRRKFGVDAARTVLGHSQGSTRITDRYTREAMEAELIAAASRSMLALG